MAADKKPSRTWDVKSIGDLAKRVVPETKSFINDKQVQSSVEISMEDIANNDIAYQHSVLCQTALPYSNPKDATLWQRKQGAASLAIQTRQVVNPKTGDYEHIGLPYGAKARLILSYINTQAIIQKDPRIYAQDNMTSFIRSLGLSVHGKSIHSIKDQLRRLSAANISLSYSDDERYVEDNTQIIKRLNLWFPKDENQRVMWDSYIDLSTDYFNSLLSHSIPLDIRAMAALSNSALALDVYSWIAQRLHRIDRSQGQFIAWVNLKKQFGFGYKDMKKFKEKFRGVLKRVIGQYPDARHSVLEIDNKGLRLTNAKPPVPYRKVNQLKNFTDNRS